MPLFETKIPVDLEKVSQIVLENWGFKVEKILQASQNHTFLASYEDAGVLKKCSVRVTPDPENKHEGRIRDELTFVSFCVKNKLKHCCGPIPVKQEQGKFYVKEDNFLIAVFEWAQGDPVNFFELKWLNDEPLILAWGRYFAHLHAISRIFSKDFPEVANRIQNWNEIHCGVLKKIVLAEEDQKDVSNPEHFGVIHGDLNTSNSYYHRQGDYFSVYDTDQTQRGFYEWDLAQAVFGLVMLKEAGMPISGDPVPQAQDSPFQKLLIKGYESVAGEGAVNLSRLSRMVGIKREFYRLFCIQAIQQGNIPKDMEPFIQFVAKAFDKKIAKQEQSKEQGKEDENSKK